MNNSSSESNSYLDICRITSKSIFFCGPYSSFSKSLRISHDSFCKLLLDLKEEKIKIKILTEISHSNVSEIRELLSYADIRHVDKLDLKFMVNESACIFFLKSNKGNHAISNLNPVINKNNEIIEQYKLVFEQLWYFGIDAMKKVQDLETAIDLAAVMHEIDKKGIKQFVGKLINTSKHEVMFYASTLWGSNNFISKDLFGLLQSVVLKNHIKVKFIIPSLSELKSNDLKHIILELGTMEQQEESNFSFRSLPQGDDLDLESLILIVDKHHLLIVNPHLNNEHQSNDVIHKDDYSYFYTTKLDSINKYKLLFDVQWGRAELAEKLYIQDMMQRNLIDTIAHELRTPTQAILGYSEMATIDIDNNEAGQHYKQYFDSIVRNANRLNSIVMNILNVAKIDNTTFNLNKEECKIYEIVSEAVNDYKYISKTDDNLKNKNIQFKVSESSEKSISANVDRIRIYEVLTNLFNNSVEFIQSTGTITVHITIVNRDYLDEKNQIKSHDYKSLKKPDDKHDNDKFILVQIKDDGKGIDKYVLSKLFNKFVSTVDNHIGLGLYISKYIIESHGGRIWAQNNTDGQGSTFSFVLPLV
ncbi:MAG TPA: HAMP domain-containing sensor histidine kinase [Candidatus Nitrosocosmicus sp.]|nr:HAMP domain-containing sensor histidine kinase [Candidatus Nitrosocosmicus sp.]